MIREEFADALGDCGLVLLSVIWNAGRLPHGRRTPSGWFQLETTNNLR